MHPVDIGGVLYQNFIPFAGDETIFTGTIVQVAHSRDISLNAIDVIFDNKIAVKGVNIVSRLWSQPTLWSYIWCGITKKIW